MSRENPIACDLEKFTKQELEEIMKMSSSLFSNVNRIKEYKDGYALCFDNLDHDSFLLMARFIYLDSKCCSFMSHALVIEPGFKNVLIRFSGGKGMKEYVYNEFKKLAPNI